MELHEENEHGCIQLVSLEHQSTYSTSLFCRKSWQSTTWLVYHYVHVIIWVWRSTAYNWWYKMDPNKVKDFAGRLQKGSKGAGLGLGLLAAAGGAAYALYQSMYTGARNENPPFRILFFPISPIVMIVRARRFSIPAGVPDKNHFINITL